MEIIKTAHLVKTILETHPETRDDDYLLWLKVLEVTCERDPKPLTVGEFLKCVKCSSFPHFETVSRSRRKAQEKYPKLRGTAETQAARAELEEEYIAFARSKAKI